MLVHGTGEDAEALRGEVAAVLAPMGLRLSPAKTKVAHMSDGFDFLGFRILHATRDRKIAAGMGRHFDEAKTRSTKTTVGRGDQGSRVAVSR